MAMKEMARGEGEGIVLDQAEVHDSKEKMQDTSLYKGTYTKNGR